MDRLTILIAFGAIVGGFLLKLISSEIQDWLPFLSRWLVRCAIARLPADERARRLEEWLADNNDYPGKIGKLCHAFGCFIGARAIARALDRPHAGNQKQRKNNRTTARNTRPRNNRPFTSWPGLSRPSR